MAKKNNKWVFLCSTAVAAMYATGYITTPAPAPFQQLTGYQSSTLPSSGRSFVASGLADGSLPTGSGSETVGNSDKSAASGGTGGSDGAANVGGGVVQPGNSGGPGIASTDKTNVGSSDSTGTNSVKTNTGPSDSTPAGSDKTNADSSDSNHVQSGSSGQMPTGNSSGKASPGSSTSSAAAPSPVASSSGGSNSSTAGSAAGSNDKGSISKSGSTYSGSGQTGSNASSSGASSSSAAGSGDSGSVATNPSAPAPAVNKVYKDGTFSGIGVNRRGGIEVAVTLKKDKITDVTITRWGMHYSESDIAVLPSKVVQMQTPHVPNVSGATFSAMAFEDAVQTALAHARNS